MLQVYIFHPMNNLIIVILVLLMIITMTISDEIKSPGVIVQPYQEYFIEHIVTQKDAAKSFKELMNQLLNGKINL